MAERKRKRTRKTVKVPKSLRELEAATTELHGENVVTVGAKRPIANHIPTGIFLLDLALLGGLPQGYISMLYGYHSSGKTTRVLRTIAEYQRKHPTKFVGIIDAEGMFDERWAEQHGVDIGRLVYADPDYGELAVDLFESMMEREDIGMIVVDSIPHMVPHKTIENSAEDDTMAALARLMSKMSAKITMANNRERRKGHWVTIVLVNQFRSKVGFVMGDPRTKPGGIQINHIPTTMIEMKKMKTVMGKDRYGNDCALMDECGFKLDKVKHGQSLRSGEYQMMLTDDNELGIPEGAVDNHSTLVTYAKRMGYVTGGGSSWKLHTANVEAWAKEARAELKEENPEATPEELAEAAEAARNYKFGKLEEIKQYLRDNAEEYETLAKSVIATQRLSKNLPALPPDGYLISERARLVPLPDNTDGSE
jgi:recombination protein RecA